MRASEPRFTGRRSRAETPDVLHYQRAAEPDKDRVPFVTREQWIEILVVGAVTGIMAWVIFYFRLLPG